MNIPGKFSSFRVRFSAIILLAISFALIQIPLFDYLGYEFSAVTALAFSIFVGFMTVSEFRSRFDAENMIPLRDFLRFTRETAFLLSVLFLVPLLVVSVNALRVKNCSYVEGMGFYLLIPGVTTALSVALASLCALVFRRARLIYCGFVFLIIGHVLWLGYYTPQIYAYNLILGYFPGISYDEVLPIGPTLIFFRIVTLLVAGWLFLMSVLLVNGVRPGDGVVRKFIVFVRIIAKDRSVPKILFVASTVVLIGAWIFRVDLGFETSTGVIQNALDQTTRTDHFVIHFAKGSFDDRDLPWIGSEHEFLLRQVAARLQMPLSAIGEIQSYIYPSEETKRRFVGTGNTNIAKPWRREVHINRNSWRQVLKHELVHVVAGGFGMPIIHANINVGLVEGLAMAVEWNFGNRTLHEYAAAMTRFKLVKNPAGMLSLSGFALQASTVSYVLSGSFCRFLIDRYGIVRFRDLYGGRSFSRVYGKDEETLAMEWQSFLLRIPVPEAWKPHVDYFFNRKSIFAKECARRVAKLNEKAFHALERNEIGTAAHLFWESLGESWNSGAFDGLVQTMYLAARYDSVIGLTDSRPDDPTGRSSSVLLMYGDSQWAEGRHFAAEQAYERALRLDVSEQSDEAATLRLAVLSDNRLRDRLFPAFAVSLADSEKVVLLDSAQPGPLVSLIKAQMLYRMKKYPEALDALRQAELERESPVLKLLKQKLFGLCEFSSKDFESARASFWQAMNYTTNGASRLRLNEWIDRCEWYGDTMKNEKMGKCVPRRCSGSMPSDPEPDEKPRGE